MTTSEIQDFIHIYSMFSFRDGRREPGIIINKYNISSSEVEYFFIPQQQMQAYKNAFEKYDRETCAGLCIRINLTELISIRPVSLSDYKLILQLLKEYEEQRQINKSNQ